MQNLSFRRYRIVKAKIKAKVKIEILHLKFLPSEFLESFTNLTHLKTSVKNYFSGSMKTALNVLHRQAQNHRSSVRTSRRRRSRQKFIN